MMMAMLAATAIVGCVALVVVATLWLQRAWRRVCERIARPFVVEHERRFSDREALIRECARECLNLVVAGQRDAVGAVAREGFSVMLEMNRQLLDEIRATNGLRTRQVDVIELHSPRSLTAAELCSCLPDASSRRSFVKRLMFWKR